MNNVVAGAIASLNLKNQQVAEGRAIVIINDIQQLAASKDAKLKLVSEYQSQLAKIQDDELTVAKVLGTPLPAAEQQTETQKTIGTAVANLVKSKQGSVQASAERLGSAILSEQQAVVDLDKCIAKKRDELNKIEIVLADESAIVGQ